MTSKKNAIIALCVLGIGTLPFHAQDADTTTRERNPAAERTIVRNMDPGVPMPPILDEAIQQIRKGGKVLDETIQQCVQESNRYFYSQKVENDVQETRDMLESDRVNYFVVCLKLAIISPENYTYKFGDWHLMYHLTDAIKRRRLVDDAPFLILCAIFPATGTGDFDTAIAAYKELLERDPFLARWAIKWHEIPYSYQASNERNAKFLKLAKALPPPQKGK